MSGRVDGLDARVWLLWGLTASLPPLIGRNPFPLAATLLAVVGVRTAWAGSRRSAASWGALLRLAALFALFGVLFNVLTVPVGDTVIAEVPERVPLVGRSLTLNALVYGLLSGLALLTLVAVGTTLGSVLDWPAVLRLLPRRLSGIATAGSVAFAFVPQTVAAFHEIREAQAARGYRPRGVRGFVPIIVPLLSGGMDRALTLAEALESRAFGSTPGDPGDSGRSAIWRRPALALGLTGGATGGYLMATSGVAIAVACLCGSLALIWLGSRDPSGRNVARTRYRDPEWRRIDTIVAGVTGLALATVLVAMARDSAGLRYEPYPSLDLPRVDLLLLLGIGLLVMPAFWAPPGQARA
jgi:energy-coupling factor transport system permease protein